MALEQQDILGRVGQELSMSVRYQEWMRALDYYLGNPRGDEIEGRSKVISTDVADAVEWIKPQIMKSLFGHEEVVVFDPTGPEDEQQAELETEMVYDVITKDNNGFLQIHNFIFDALLQKFGVLKCYYQPEDGSEVIGYTGLSEQQVTMALADPNVQVMDMQQGEDGSVSIKIAVPKKGGRIVIQAIPPEQFRYSSDHRSIDLCDARFTAQVSNVTLSDLAEQGYDPELLEEIGHYIGYDPSLYRMRAQKEVVWEGQQINDDESLRLIEVAECYMKMDINDDGIAEKVKVTVVGGTNPSHLLGVEEIDEYPWIATSAIVMPHKFEGFSIYDRLRQIQDIKTALLRNTIDNISFQNNQRLVITEGQVNIDDVLISRPGGVIRAKSPDAVVALQTPAVGQSAFSLLQYLDEVRAGRVGVAPEGGATPQKVGSNVGSQGVEQLLTAKEELVGLIIRIIAETGIKPLYQRIRSLLVRHVDAIQNVKFRGQWVQTNPALWPTRSRSTIRVGTGSGDNSQRSMVIQQILQIQAQIQQLPGQALVSPAKVYSALDDMCKFGQLNGASRYFMDPGSPEGQQAAAQAGQAMQAQQQQAMQQQMALLQAEVKIADAEMQKANVAAANAQLKNQVDTLKAQIDTLKSDADRELARQKMVLDTAIKLTDIESKAKAQEDQNYLDNAALAQASQQASGATKK
jgi:hypothetical protein